MLAKQREASQSTQPITLSKAPYHIFRDVVEHVAVLVAGHPADVGTAAPPLIKQLPILVVNQQEASVLVHLQNGLLSLFGGPEQPA